LQAVVQVEPTVQAMLVTVVVEQAGIAVLLLEKQVVAVLQ
jgi:hypothetical protein